MAEVVEMKGYCRTFWASLALAGFLSIGASGPLGASEAVALRAFEGFVRTIGPLCQWRASRDCAEVAWAFADSDNDQYLTLQELEDFKEGLKAWALWKEEALPPQTRNGIFLGLLIAESIGLAPLFESFDDDKDGRLTREELFQDVRLDERPLNTVLLDPEAFDREAFAARLGAMGNLLKVLEQ